MEGGSERVEEGEKGRERFEERAKIGENDREWERGSEKEWE